MFKLWETQPLAYTGMVFRNPESMFSQAMTAHGYNIAHMLHSCAKRGRCSTFTNKQMEPRRIRMSDRGFQTSFMNLANKFKYCIVADHPFNILVLIENTLPKIVSLSKTSESL